MTATVHVDNLKTSGQLIRDAGTFHQILDGSTLSSSGNSGWLDVGFIHECTLHVELGNMAGTVSLVVEQADDGSGGGSEVLGTFTQFTATDDNEQAKLGATINKRYVRAVYTVASGGGAVTLTARLPTDHYDTAYSGTSS